MSHNTCGLNVILKAESKDRNVFPLSAKNGKRSCTQEHCFYQNCVWNNKHGTEQNHRGWTGPLETV